MQIASKARGRALRVRASVLGAVVAAGLPVWTRGAGPGLVISEWMAEVTGMDGAQEYVELVATRDIDFVLNPYSVIFCNNGTGRSNGWIFGLGVTYAFNIDAGSVKTGDVVYVGGSAMGDRGVRLRTRDVTTQAGDGGIGNANPAGALGNGGSNADGIAIFDVIIGSVTQHTVPVDAIFFGDAVGGADPKAGGYELPSNDHYAGGKLRSPAFLAPSAVMDLAGMATSGMFDTVSGTWAAPRGFENKAGTAGVTALTLLFPSVGPAKELVWAPSNLVPASYAWNRSPGNANWLNASQSPAAFANGDTVTFNSAGAGVVTIDPSGVAPASITVNNELNSSYTFAGGPVNAAAWIDKRGDGTLRFGLPTDTAPSRNTFFGGLNIDGGAVQTASEPAGRAAFRSNAVYVEQGAALAFSAEPASAELRIGELGGAGNVTAVSGVSGVGRNLVIHALGDAAFSGVLDVGGPTVQRGWLMVRGAATQTLSARPAASPAWTAMGHGAGLTLAGDGAISDPAARILLDGGTLTLDNAEKNLPAAGRLADGGGSPAIQGSGRLRFIGNAGGSYELAGGLSPNYGSAIAVEVRHTSPSADTVLHLARLEQNSGSTVSFELGDGNPADAFLPRILLGSFAGTYQDALPGELALYNGIIARKGSGVPAARGFAVVNSEDWATVDLSSAMPEIRAYSAYAPMSAAAGPADNVIIQASHAVNGVQELNSVKIAASVAGQSLTITAGGHLNTFAVLHAGTADYAIAGAGAFLGVGAERHLHIKDGRTLTVNAPIVSDGGSMIVKSGEGVLVLGGTQTFTDRLVLSRGIVRAAPGSGLPAAVTLAIRGGVFEVAGPETPTTLHLPLGDGSGQVNWSTRNAPSSASPIDTAGGRSAGSGGFAAFGGPRSINLGAAGIDSLKWEQPYFVQAGQALVFGSIHATHPIQLIDDLSLDPASADFDASYNLREIRVVDNPRSASDRAVLSGRLTGSIRNDLLKTGDGILELTANNANVTGEDGFNGGIIIGEGTLQLGHDQALGNAAHLRLGLRSGAANSALLARPGITVAHDIHVTMGNSGVATLGGTAAGPGPVFTGAVHAENNANLQAASGTMVTFAGPVNVGEGVSLAKTGPGDVDVTGPLSLHAYSDLSVMEGVLHVGQMDAAVVWVDAGAKLILRDESALSTMQWLDMAREANGDWTGTVDITSNRLRLAGGDMARIHSQVAQGLRDGRGIVSSLTGGIVTLAVLPDEEGVLVVRAYAGDLDGDGRVDGADYHQLDRSFLAGVADPLYFHGDVDYSGEVNGDDYFKVDQAFLGQGSTLPGREGVVLGEAIAVPEPGTLWMGGLAGAGLLLRRGRRGCCPIIGGLPV